MQGSVSYTLLVARPDGRFTSLLMSADEGEAIDLRDGHRQAHRTSMMPGRFKQVAVGMGATAALTCGAGHAAALMQ